MDLDGFPELYSLRFDRDGRHGQGSLLESRGDGGAESMHANVRDMLKMVPTRPPGVHPAYNHKARIIQGL